MDELISTEKISEPLETLQDDLTQQRVELNTTLAGAGEPHNEEVISRKDGDFDEISEGSFELQEESSHTTSFRQKSEENDAQQRKLQEDAISEDIEFEDYRDVQDEATQKEVETEDASEEEKFYDIEDSELADQIESNDDSQEEIEEVTTKEAENADEDNHNPNETFEEVDTNSTFAEKAGNTQDSDILSDDRTQVIEDSDNNISVKSNNVEDNILEKKNESIENLGNISVDSTSKIDDEYTVVESNEEGKSSDKSNFNQPEIDQDFENKNESVSSVDVDNKNKSDINDTDSKLQAIERHDGSEVNTDSDSFEKKDIADKNLSTTEKLSEMDHEMDDPAEIIHGDECSELNAKYGSNQNLSECDETTEGMTEDIEHVQEPEESDICLIPDREKEVTDAEREQAILVREIAEKEDNDVQNNINQSNEEEARGNQDQSVEDSHLELTESESEHSNKIIISTAVAISENCIKCNQIKRCGFSYKNAETGDDEYFCDNNCVQAFLVENVGKYLVRRKKLLVEEISETTEQTCFNCMNKAQCKYFFKHGDDSFYICQDDCFNLLTTEDPEKFKLKRHSIRVRNIGATISTAKKDSVTDSELKIVARSSKEAEVARLDRAASFQRRCNKCLEEIDQIDQLLHWQTMDFCNEQCLGQYQRNIGAFCKKCKAEVSAQSMSKYCVRFGNEIQQFCSGTCLTEFKKVLKTCSCCQKDISGKGEGFLASIGDKEQFKDFCSQACMRRYATICNPKKKLRTHQCAVCNNEKVVRVEIIIDKKEHCFCSNPCFSAFKFVSNIVSDQCGMCSKYFERKSGDAFTIYTDKRPKVFCSLICKNIFIIVNRKIESCQWCKVKKYNFDMIFKYTNDQNLLICSLNCLTLYGVSVNAFSRTIVKCDNCNNSETPQYHLTMSDSSMRNFCTYQCVMQFQSQFSRTPLTIDGDSTPLKKSLPFPTGLPKRVKLKKDDQPKHSPVQTQTLPIISTVSSLASGESETMIGNVTVRRSNSGRGRSKTVKNKYVEQSPSPVPPVPTSPQDENKTSPTSPKQVLTKKKTATSLTSNDSAISDSETKTKIITVPPLPPLMRNIMTQCRPIMVSKDITCKPAMVDAEMQTDDDHSNKVIIPIPVPIYVPQPMYMYSAPFPCPVPIPLPIPVPIFIPTTRNSASGIMKEIKKIQDKMPADPFEAELLMMAEMVADEKHDSDSDSDDGIKGESAEVPYTNNVTIDHNQSYGDDVLQMALKMASGDYEEPNSVDLESAMQANTISNPPPGIVVQEDSHGLGHQIMMMEGQQSNRGRGRKRISPAVSPSASRNNVRTPIKRIRRDIPVIQQHETPPHTIQPIEKPDVNMCLKYTFGVNAWKQWVVTKNNDLEKSSIRRRPFKTELLQMTADELNYSLCLFVKEVRKPNGSEYAPDTIYYLVLGIQQYLYENGRIDNIFTDPYYERFTDCLDEAAQKFSVLYNDSQYIVTRVEEEHLWECKQLGAHSPHVLLSTLMFFNTKHFNLTTVEEHMQLSFSHIMKHWKRTAQNTKSPGARNVLLRFYPPQAGLDANPRKKKVYEQQENEENPLRCPVRLYEFYLSKCPESVKTRNDVFYLQPERSCVPDSPVWYSTQALSQEALQKMLHRVKMVKEINIALLTS